MSILRVFVIFLNFSCKRWGTNFNEVQPFLPHPFQYIVHNNPTTWCYITLESDEVSLNKLWKKSQTSSQTTWFESQFFLTNYSKWALSHRQARFKRKLCNNRHKIKLFSPLLCCHTTDMIIKNEACWKQWYTICRGARWQWTMNCDMETAGVIFISCHLNVL